MALKSFVFAQLLCVRTKFAGWRSQNVRPMPRQFTIEIFPRICLAVSRTWWVRVQAGEPIHGPKDPRVHRTADLEISAVAERPPETMAPGDARPSRATAARSPAPACPACDNRCSMDAGWRITVIWACFAARLLFYAAMLPLWEGFDEWAHFAAIRAMASHGVALVPRNAPVPRDVAESLNLAPVAWELRNYPPPAVTEDAFWTSARRRTPAARSGLPGHAGGLAERIRATRPYGLRGAAAAALLLADGAGGAPAGRPRPGGAGAGHPLAERAGGIAGDSADLPGGARGFCRHAYRAGMRRGGCPDARMGARCGARGQRLPVGGVVHR